MSEEDVCPVCSAVLTSPAANCSDCGWYVGDETTLRGSETDSLARRRHEIGDQWRDEERQPPRLRPTSSGFVPIGAELL